MIREVWKLNVSTVIILPIFNDLTSDLKIDNSKITFMQLCFMYNLTGCFLTAPLDQIALVFPKQNGWKKLDSTNFKNSSLNEFLITRPGFSSFTIYNDYIIYYFDIPKEYRKDIDKIHSGKYSEVSNNFKKACDISKTFKHLKKTNTIADFLSTSNVARSILYKERYMKELIEKYLGTEVPKENEYFKPFVSSNEIININHYRL